MRRRFLGWLALVFLATCVVAVGVLFPVASDRRVARSGPATEVTARERELLEDLRQGGYVILIFSTSPEQPRLVGTTFDELGIPVGQVFYDPAARNTVEQAFDQNRAEVSGALDRQNVSGVQRVDELDTGLRRLLSKPPAPGENVVLVAELPTEDFGEPGPEENVAETAIFKPLGTGAETEATTEAATVPGSFQRVAAMPHQRWAELTRSER